MAWRRSDGEARRPGLNARAALITRGLAEMTRLGVALGARAETFMGLSGLGDLVLTATGDLSRNRRVGLLLAQGLALPRHPAAARPCGRGRVQRADAAAPRAGPGRADADHRRPWSTCSKAASTPLRAMAQLMSREATREH